MADYTPLISRAVGALAQNTGEARRAVYERARGALLAQLRGITPPLPEEQITRERTALEEAIRKVEAENATEGLDQLLERELMGLAQQRTTRAEPISIGGARSVSAAAQDAEQLGDAAASTRRAAQDQLSIGAGRPADEDRVEPALEPSSPFVSANDAGRAPIRPRVSVLGEEEETPRRRGRGGFAALLIALLLLGGAGALGWYVAVYHPERLPEQLRTIASAPPPAAQAPTPAPAPAADPDRPKTSDRVGDAPPAAPAPSATPSASPAPRQVVPVDPPAAPLPPVATDPAPTDTPPTASDPAPQTAAPAAPAPADPVPPAAQAPAPGPAPPLVQTPTQPQAAAGSVAPQRAALFEETPGNAAGTLMQGSVIWRTQTVSVGPGQPPDLALVGEVNIPERRMVVTITIRRNLDQTLPASHTIEVLFALPRDFQFGGVAEVPGVLMKASEQARGVPLVGQAVRVTNGFFFIGLSSFDMDRNTNIQALKTRPFFDIPVRYDSGRRGILTVEKGATGDRAIEEAMQAWGQ
jgi:cytoskeletal protein RodZ